MQAVRFIRDYAFEAINMNDVLGAVPLSLETRSGFPRRPATGRVAPNGRSPYTVPMSISKMSVVQSATQATIADTLQKVRRLTERSADCGATLALFPEAMVGGYPKGEDFGVRLGSRSPEGRAAFRAYFEAAIDVPGPETAELAKIARICRTYLVIGVIERDGATLYCTALFFDPHGALVAKHRKLMPTAMEKLIWGMGDGATMPVIPTPYGKVGAVICWENYMPLLRTYMYGKGIQIYCAPTLDERESWAASMRHIALEGRCFVLSACQCTEGLTTDAGKSIRGGSLIVNPLGKVLAGPVYDVETVLTVEIDLNETIEGKFDLDVVGHYARPDIFRLHVDETGRRTVSQASQPEDEPFADESGLQSATKVQAF